MRIDRIKLISTMARKCKTGLELSKETGLSRATISAIKGGKSCTEATARTLANALGVDVTELLEEE